MTFDGSPFLRLARVLVVAYTCAAVPASTQQSTLASPNVLVSRDGPAPKTEPLIAAHPQLPGTLLATAIVNELADTCRIYRSTDGGRTWQIIDFDELREHACGDPQIAFGAGGRAYFAVLTFRPDAVGRKRSVVAVYRSDDAGLTWLGPVIAGFGLQPDHPQLAAFSRAGQPDRIYVTVLHQAGTARRISLFRSDDGGGSFAPPRTVVESESRGLFNGNLVTLSDGALVVPYVDSELAPPLQRKDPMNRFMLTTSTDGGLTFASPQPVAAQHVDPNNPIARMFPPSLVAADVTSTRYRDRLYALWSDFSSGRSKLQLSYSIDRGSTWSAPTPVDSGAPHTSDQFRAALAVSPDGTVGAAWFDNRAGESVYAEHFAASLDGGASFLPAVRVSFEPSPRRADGNIVFRPTIDSPSVMPEGELTFALSNAAERFPDGGDYVGLVASADGIFHPFWPDSRTGSYQLWTARVTVNASEQAATAPQADHFLNRALRPFFDKATFDAASRSLDVAVRVRNISTTTVCGPLFAYIAEPEAPVAGTRAAAVLNAVNGRPWHGAMFDYSNSFGSYRCLPGGETSNPVSWKIRLAESQPGFVGVQIRFTANRRP